MEWTRIEIPIGSPAVEYTIDEYRVNYRLTQEVTDWLVENCKGLWNCPPHVYSPRFVQTTLFSLRVVTEPFLIDFEHKNMAMYFKLRWI